MDRAIVTVRQLALLLGDAAVFFLALAAAVALRRVGGAGIRFADHLPPFAVVFAIWIVTLYVVGLYDLTVGRNRVRLMRELGTALAVNAGTAIAFFYLAPGVGIAPKTTLFFALACTAVLLVAWRFLYDRFLVGGRWRSRILFVGLTDEAREVIRRLADEPHLGLDVVGAIVLDGTDAPGVPVRRTLEGFAGYLRDQRIDTVVLCMSPRSSPELARHLYESIFLKVSFVDGIGFYEQVTRRVPVSAITHAWFLENLQESGKRVYEAVKRAADLFVALALGVVTLAASPFVALAVWLPDRGPVFFTQERLGRDGRRFRVIKFRTMVTDAEKDGARFAEKDDRRVTAVGRVLRMTRIDELPQAWNVLTGDMSVIGPRPERPAFAEEITADMPYYRMRLLVRPGLTGWAQVHRGYYATPEEHRLKLQYDLYYIKNRSSVLDGIILLKTLSTVLRAKGQ